VPHTLGHEGSGVVLEVGPEVVKVRPGDRVILTWIKGSGLDAPSVAYESGTGRVNSGAISTFLRHAVIAENRLVKLPTAVPLREAALLGCAVPTGAGMAIEGGITAGKSAAVFGCGGVGLCAVMMARALGAARVIAVDIHPVKLELAKAFGATDVLDASAGDPVAAIRALTGGAGVDCAIEAAGTRQTGEAAFNAVRAGGGLAVIGGNPAFGERIAISPMDLIRGKRIVGSWGGGSVPERDAERFAQLYESGALPLAKLLTHTYPLEGVNQALDDLEAGRIGRGLIAMGPAVVPQGSQA
jgi:S-(hydroxymethyl)glutathione dehydrogenase/alcohol dehydrogenase